MDDEIIDEKEIKELMGELTEMLVNSPDRQSQNFIIKGIWSGLMKAMKYNIGLLLEDE